MAKTVYPKSPLDIDTCKRMAAIIRNTDNPKDLIDYAKNNNDMMLFLGCNDDSSNNEIWEGIKEQWRAIKKEKIK